MKRYAQGNGWIDKDGTPIDSQSRDRAEAKQMADNVSKGAAFSAAACVLMVACAPAAPGIAAIGLSAGILKDFLFDMNPASFGTDLVIDKTLTTVGSALKIPTIITVPISEGIKDSREIAPWKDRQSLIGNK